MIQINIADCNHGSVQIETETAKILAEKYGIEINVKYTNSSQESMVPDCVNANVLIVQRRNVNGPLIQQLPKCKVVSRYGVGLDNIDVSAMRQLGISVVHFPGFCTEEVANHATALILFLYRRLGNILRQNDLTEFWGKPDLLLGTFSASETVIGIIGLGRIGSAVACRLKACGFQIVAYDPYVSDERFAELQVNRITSLQSLIATVDILSIHCPLTDETENMINKDLLQYADQLMIVNTARGKILNASDLKNAIVKCKVRSAFLDVCDPEPVDPQFRHCPNIYISPHCAFYSEASLYNLKRDIIIKSVEAFLCSQPELG